MLRQILFIKLTTKREQKQNGGRKNLAKKCFWRHNNFVNQLTSKILLTVDSREKKERRKRGQLFLSPSYAIFFFSPKSSVFIFLFSNFLSFLKWLRPAAPFLTSSCCSATILQTMSTDILLACLSCMKRVGDGWVARLARSRVQMPVLQNLS